MLECKHPIVSVAMLVMTNMAYTHVVVMLYAMGMLCQTVVVAGITKSTKQVRNKFMFYDHHFL